MSTEDEQDKLYRDLAVKNAYEILCARFCRIENAFEFQEMGLEEKKKYLKELAEELI